jgi:hypothetical protein
MQLKYCPVVGTKRYPKKAQTLTEDSERRRLERQLILQHCHAYSINGLPQALMYSYFSEARDVNQSICLQQAPSGTRGDSELNAILQQFHRILQATKIIKQKKGSQKEVKETK